jgi:inosine-uridine nucleoside N-ribohydrolase
MNKSRLPVFVDCDNTMGLPRSEIDDGLTLLYLLGRPDLELVGVSATHGNGTAEEAYRQTRWLFDRVGARIPVHAGGQEAAEALSRASRSHDGLTVLALGAQSNLALAARIDPDFYGRLGTIVLMGGYIRPLRFLRHPVHELNLSSDPDAARSVLTAPCPVTVMSAQFCLGARFGLRDLWTTKSPVWLQEQIRHWFYTFSTWAGSAGFYLWDLVPAASVGENAWPGLADNPPLVRLLDDTSDLSAGFLSVEPTATSDQRTAGVIGLPSHRFDRRSFVRHCVELWNRGAGTKNTHDSI